MSVRDDLGDARQQPNQTPANPALAIASEEQHLLQQVTLHDEEAFDALYVRYGPQVRRYLSRRLNRHELIDDVLQDVMLVLWQHAGKVPKTVPLGAWLCGVARHKASKVVARVAAPPRSQASYANREEDEPEAVILRQEHGRTLARALAALPLRERTALELLVYHGYSRGDIAAVTGDPVSTVRTRVSRARHRLQARVAAVDRERGGHRAW